MKLSFLISFLVMCQLPSEGSTFYLDPENGDINNDGSISNPLPSMQEVVDAGLINTFSYTLPYDQTLSTLAEVNPSGIITGGDTIMLLDGLHGSLFIRGAHNERYITVMAAPGATPIIRNIDLISASKWRWLGVTISLEPYGEYADNNLLWLHSHSFHGPTHHVEVRNCMLYSTLENDDWTAQDWIDRASNGIRINADNVDVDDCHLLNVRFGVSCIGSSINVRNSVVENFSGDGMRVLGPDILLEGNTIKNCIKVDDNHDDGIQSFNLDTYDVRNVTIRANTIINFEDPDQPLRGPLQGIGCFDGPFNNWTIENNIIAVDHWHAISLYGAYDCVIRHNTVLDPTPEETPGSSWIRVNPHKDGTESEGNLVVNNITNRLVLSGSDAFANIGLTSITEYEDHFGDHLNYDFTLIPTSTAIDGGIDSLANKIDFVGNSRPQGAHVDVGAYEYLFPTSIVEREQKEIYLYPNPVHDVVTLSEVGSEIKLYNVHGSLLLTISADTKSLDVSQFATGLYFIKFDDDTVLRFIKQ